MISESTNSPTAVISQLVITDTRSGSFNSASAVSTLIFLMVFVIAFMMVKYLGANVAGPQNMPKAQRSCWTPSFSYVLLPCRGRASRPLWPSAESEPGAADHAGLGRAGW